MIELSRPGLRGGRKPPLSSNFWRCQNGKRSKEKDHRILRDSRRRHRFRGSTSGFVDSKNCPSDGTFEGSSERFSLEKRIAENGGKEEKTSKIFA